MLNTPVNADEGLRATETPDKTRNGVPLLKTRKDVPPITDEFVNRLREELPNE
jgi:hypothetical protein